MVHIFPDITNQAKYLPLILEYFDRYIDDDTTCIDMFTREGLWYTSTDDYLTYVLNDIDIRRILFYKVLKDIPDQTKFIELCRTYWDTFKTNELQDAIRQYTAEQSSTKKSAMYYVLCNLAAPEEHRLPLFPEAELLYFGAKLKTTKTQLMTVSPLQILDTTKQRTFVYINLDVLNDPDQKDRIIQKCTWRQQATVAIWDGYGLYNFKKHGRCHLYREFGETGYLFIYVGPDILPEGF